MTGAEEGSGPPEGVPGRVAVARFRRLKAANDYALVVLSMNLPYWLIREESRYVLYVPEEYGEAVREQLERYRRESRYWPPVESMESPLSASSLSLWLYCLVLGSFFYLSHGSPAAREQWFALGRLDAERVLEAGEWYRVATALTLHADIGHLAGNLAGGALFAYFVLRILGSGLGWLLVLAAGMLGNALNVATHAGTGHLSVGASTAVFGALGLIVGHQLVRAWRTSGWRWPRRMWIPLGGGLVLLGFLGAGGERTDVLAHLWGFLAGLFLAVPFAWEAWAWIRSGRVQAVLAALVVAVVALAWMAAFTAV